MVPLFNLYCNRSGDEIPENCGWPNQSKSARFYKRPLINTGMNKLHNAVWKNRYFVCVFLVNSCFFVILYWSDTGVIWLLIFLIKSSYKRKVPFKYVNTNNYYHMAEMWSEGLDLWCPIRPIFFWVKCSSFWASTLIAWAAISTHLEVAELKSSHLDIVRGPYPAVTSLSWMYFR